MLLFVYCSCSMYVIRARQYVQPAMMIFAFQLFGIVWIAVDSDVSLYLIHGPVETAIMVKSVKCKFCNDGGGPKKINTPLILLPDARRKIRENFLKCATIISYLYFLLHYRIWWSKSRLCCFRYFACAMHIHRFGRAMKNPGVRHVTSKFESGTLLLCDNDCLQLCIGVAVTKTTTE